MNTIHQIFTKINCLIILSFKNGVSRERLFPTDMVFAKGSEGLFSFFRTSHPIVLRFGNNGICSFKGSFPICTIVKILSDYFRDLNALKELDWFKKLENSIINLAIKLFPIFSRLNFLGILRYLVCFIYHSCI